MTAQMETAARFEPEMKSEATPHAAGAEVFAERYRAPFALRCGALLIDYIILVVILAVSSIFARAFGGGARAAGLSVEMFGYFLALAVVIINYGVLASWRGQTVGKWATGLRIERRGQPGLTAGVVGSLLRHFVGYPLSLLPLGGGFVLALLNARGLALHDLIAGTVVVRAEKFRNRSVRPWGVRP